MFELYAVFKWIVQSHKRGDVKQITIEIQNLQNNIIGINYQVNEWCRKNTRVYKDYKNE